VNFKKLRQKSFGFLTKSWQRGMWVWCERGYVCGMCGAVRGATHTQTLRVVGERGVGMVGMCVKTWT